MVETLAFVYTSEAEIVNVYSQAGLDFSLDDLVAELAQAKKEFIEDATDFINQYAGDRYDEADMTESRWVRSRASWIAAYFFSQRRGNPPPESFAVQFDRFEKELMQVKDDTLNIPRLGTSSNFIPSISNYEIDDRSSVRKIRVQPEISSGGTYPEQDVSHNHGTDWH